MMHIFPGDHIKFDEDDNGNRKTWLYDEYTDEFKALMIEHSHKIVFITGAHTHNGDV